MNITVVLVVGLVNFEYSDRSKNHVAYDYANNIIRTVEYDMVSEGFDEAVVFAQGDNIVFPLYYVLLVERPDLNIRVIERTGIINHDFYGGEFAGLEKEVREIEGQKRESSVFIEGTPAYYTSGEDVIYDGYELEQRGLLHRVLEKDAGGSDFEYWSLYVYRQIWNTSIELDPMSKELRKLYYKKLAGYHLGFDRERAAYLLELAVDMSPDDAMLRHELGNVLVGNRQYERAIAHLEVAAMMQPENQRIINNMGFAFSMMGENSKARQQYLKALSIDPGYAPARANLAGLLLESGELSKATEHYSIVIRQDPKNANAYLNLARIAHMNQNHQAAATLWQHYLELEPESPIAGEIRTYIEDVRNRQSESETDGG